MSDHNRYILYKNCWDALFMSSKKRIFKYSHIEYYLGWPRMA